MSDNQYGQRTQYIMALEERIYTLQAQLEGYEDLEQAYEKLQMKHAIFEQTLRGYAGRGGIFGGEAARALREAKKLNEEQKG